MARFFPFVKAAEERMRTRDPELSKRERRTGARFLRLSTAVRHDRFAQASQLFDTAFDRPQGNEKCTGYMAVGEAFLPANVDDGYGALRRKGHELFQRNP
jgi:hypothetical protein